MKVTEFDPGPEARALAQQEGISPAYYDLTTDDGRAYRAILSRDPITPVDHRWHLSISGGTDVPPWSVLSEACHLLRPGVSFVLGVPPKSWWLNRHPHCLHLWELKDQTLIDQWRYERQGDTPT